MNRDFNLNGVIRLELRNKHGHKLSTKKVELLSRTLNIDYDQLALLNSNYRTIWFIPDGIRMDIICVIYDSEPTLHFSGKFQNATPDVQYIIAKMSPTEIVTLKRLEQKIEEAGIPLQIKPNKKITIPVEGPEEELDMDTILDKINETGMHSLTRKELEFLKSLSK